MSQRMTRRMLAAGLALATATAGYVALAGGSGTATATAAPRSDDTVVIGHRGASGHRPEHTLAAYRLAIGMGADYIEPDIVATKDGRLVARHDNWLADTTDVESHPEFAARKTTKVIDGVSRTDWFTEDFTLAELETLTTEERIPGDRPENAAFNGTDHIPTLDEVLKLAREASVGVYPETKHPTYFDGIGLSLEEPLVKELDAHGFNKRDSKVFIQSFETANLRDLEKMTKVRLVQLISDTGAPYDFVAGGDPRTYDDLVKPEGLRWISSYADGIGPATARIVPLDPDGSTGAPTTLVRDAHRLGMDVHTWTIRNENKYLPADLRQGDPQSPVHPRATGNTPGWLEMLMKLGVDGFFCDDPSMCVAARTEVLGG
jgi:glycerophosphoryl diester phosphodiesterase